MGHRGFARIALKGGVVLGTSQAIKAAIQLLGIAVLSRMLDPADFGIVAAVAPLVAFAALFQDLGFQHAIVQREDLSQKLLNQTFWIAAATGSACAGIVAALSPAVGAFYGEPATAYVTVALAIPLVMGSLSCVARGLLSRGLSFGRIACAEILAAVTGFATSVALASSGAGYWSIVAGSLTGSAVSLASVWLMAGWRPQRPDFRMDRGMAGFGFGLTGFNALNFLSRHLDNVLIGKAYGTVELGLYDRAYKLFMNPMRYVTEPLGKVMVPVLSRMQDDKERLRLTYLKAAWAMSAVTVPGIAALAIVPGETVSVLMGPRWDAVGPILGWLAVAGAIQPMSISTGWLFISQGKTRDMMKWGVFSSSVTAVSFMTGLPWGAVGVAAAYAISGYLLRLPGISFMIGRIGPVTTKDMFVMQGFFIVSAGLAWLLVGQAEAALSVESDLGKIAVALGANYVTAASMVAAFPTSRRLVGDSIRAALARNC